MFEVGERVVCIKPHPGSYGMQCGRVYVVRAILPGSDVKSADVPPSVCYTVALCEIAHVAEPRYGFSPYRFRPLRKLDISESLKALKGLAADCPPILAKG